MTVIDRSFPSRHGLWLVLLLALAVGLAFQGNRHLWDPDEGRYTDVAHEMLELDDWLVPRLSAERPHFTKPPITYWAIAASFSAFGKSEWAARLPNALAFALTAMLVFGIAGRLRLVDPVLAAGIWMTMWAPVIASNAVTSDTLLTLFETLAVYGFVVSGILDPDATPRRWGMRLMWLGFGLAFMTKGPPGLLPLAAIVAFVAWRRRLHLQRLFDLAGLAVFAVTGLTWYLVLVWRFPGALDYFLVEETVSRIATGQHHRNAGWFGWLAVYLPTFLIGTMPWLAIAAATWWSRRRSGARAAALDPAASRFLLLWFALPLGVFVLSQSRLPFYVLPLFVPVSLALAASLGGSVIGRRAVIAFGLAIVAAVSLKGGGALIHPGEDADRLAVELQGQVDLAAVETIVFVDSPARYGLKHYTGKTVDQAESYRGAIGPGGYVQAETLCHELASGKNHLLVVPTRELGEIEDRLNECPRDLERVGTLRKWTLLRPAN